MKIIVMFLLLTGAATAQEFSRYQIVIDRSPFGPISASGAVMPEPNFAQRYQFVALVTSNGDQGVVQAIIFDKEANRSFFRAQGESLDNGVKVERIDVEPVAKVVLKSGLETAQLVFQSRATAPAAMPVPQPGVQPAPLPGPHGGPSPVRRIPFRRGN